MMVFMVAVLSALINNRSANIVVQEENRSDSISKSEKMIRILLDGESVDMDMNDYLTGVLLCEIPESFHLEAKKAQAVAARTFVLRMEKFSLRHGECAVCSDPGCCQGYMDETLYLKQGGPTENVSECRRAVEETDDLAMYYGDELIEATYFSCSGGKTEDAIAVWGTEIPYLQSVNSPGEEYAEYYTDSVIFTASEFQNMLGKTLEGSPNEWFGNVEYTDGSGVSTIVIGGKRYTGNELRFLLNLKSTWFSVTTLSDSIIFTTRGFGHRVGLSQYGADAMARSGSTWQEILEHYYQDIEIRKDGY